jgi:hypothetical protein
VDHPRTHINGVQHEPDHTPPLRLPPPLEHHQVRPNKPDVFTPRHAPGTAARTHGQYVTASLGEHASSALPIQ